MAKSSRIKIHLPDGLKSLWEIMLDPKQSISKTIIDNERPNIHVFLEGNDNYTIFIIPEAVFVNKGRRERAYVHCSNTPKGKLVTIRGICTIERQ